MRKSEKRICIFGSTGSIGRNTLSVIDNLVSNGKDLKLQYLTAGRNARLLCEQIEKYRPEAVVIEDEASYHELRNCISAGSTEVLCGNEELLNIAAGGDYDLAVSSVSGFSGLAPTLRALKSGKNVALANKETLVSAGHLVDKILSANGTSIYPIDSEHSAILQCIAGEDRNSISKVVLTASGGPFLYSTREEMEAGTPERALEHPNWRMGKKITIDSATMMNKGLEVIEAKWLYGLDLEQIEVIIHPQSIVHSFVEFHDGSVKAQLGVPDMKIPIQYALTYPERISSDFPRIDFTALSGLQFMNPDPDKFKCLSIAYDAMRSGESYPAVLNSSNEAAVRLFLEGKIGFMQIPDIIRQQLDDHVPENLEEPEEIIELDRRVNEDVERRFRNIEA